MSNVFDANCWCLYVEDELAAVDGIGKGIFAAAKTCGGYLLDAGDQAKQQYIDMKKPYAEQIFDIWVEKVFLSGHLRLVSLSGKDNMFKELGSLGLPKKEHVFFRIAVFGNADRIISLDSDFFDPAMKKAGQAEKLILIESGSGPVCKHTKKNYGIAIMCPKTFLEAAAA